MTIILLNLDRSPDRLAKFKARNTHLKDVKRFSAIDGREISRGDLIKNGLVQGEPAYTLGAIGAFLSHAAQWETSVRTGKVVTVVEDDAVISKEFEACSQRLIGSLERWDVIFWGWNFDAYLWIDLMPGISPAVIQTFQDRLRLNVDAFQNQQIPHHLFRLLHLFGMAAYSVTPKGAQAMLEFCLPIRPLFVSFRDFPVRVKNSGIDYMLNGVLPDLYAFVCIPPLVVVENRHDDSTIQGS